MKGLVQSSPKSEAVPRLTKRPLTAAGADGVDGSAGSLSLALMIVLALVPQ